MFYEMTHFIIAIDEVSWQLKIKYICKSLKSKTIITHLTDI